ncbi:MAG TPA: hypothetical protein V6D48_15225 [Oculatellaceae cyanobacterium]
MQYIKRFREALYLATVVLTLAILESTSYQLPVLSEAKSSNNSNIDNPFCYMNTEEGLTLNLESLCKVERQRPTESLSAKDRQFIEDYKKFLKGYPKAQAALSYFVENNPQMIIRKAAEVCNELKTRRFSNSRRTHPDIDADILNSIAPEYYCREFDD